MSRFLSLITALAVLGLAAGCGGDGDDDDDNQPTDTTVSGVISFPDDATGTCGMVAVDDDFDPSNGPAQRDDLTYLWGFELLDGTSLSFSYDDVPAGSYYVWAYVDLDSSDSNPAGNCEISGAPTAGDYFGFFDTGLSIPPAPNVEIPDTPGDSYDFGLLVIP